eukprot:gene12885-7306_t
MEKILTKAKLKKPKTRDAQKTDKGYKENLVKKENNKKSKLKNLSKKVQINQPIKKRSIQLKKKNMKLLKIIKQDKPKWEDSNRIIAKIEDERKKVYNREFQKDELKTLENYKNAEKEWIEKLNKEENKEDENEMEIEEVEEIEEYETPEANLIVRGLEQPYMERVEEINEIIKRKGYKSAHTYPLELYNHKTLDYTKLITSDGKTALEILNDS